MPRLLVELRGNLKQADAGALADLPQHRISRAEQGRYPLSPDEADLYARALGAPASKRRRLVQLATTHRAENITGRKHLIRNAHAVQRRIGDLEAQVRTIRSWVPDVVTGILQTPAYTETLVGERDERWWIPRRARIALLDDPDRTFRLLISEAVLRWGIGTRKIMAAQINHLITMDQRPNITLGIVPLDAIHPIAMPRGFQLYGDGTASVATEVGTTFVTESTDLQVFLDDFTHLNTIATTGEQLHHMLSAAAARWS